MVLNQNYDGLEEKESHIPEIMAGCENRAHGVSESGSKKSGEELYVAGSESSGLEIKNIASEEEAEGGGDLSFD